MAWGGKHPPPTQSWTTATDAGTNGGAGGCGTRCGMGTKTAVVCCMTAGREANAGGLRWREAKPRVGCVTVTFLGGAIQLHVRLYSHGA